MSGHDPSVDVPTNYRNFALEAAGKSPAYRRLAEDVAGDRRVLGFLDDLPWEKRQPNLLFAAARYLTGEPVPDIALLHDLLAERADELAGLMRLRRTQTNEVGRCAVLLPALAALPQPLALLEVGASAGLTLLPDRYSYEYLRPDGSVHRVAGHASDAVARPPLLRCAVSGPVPLPAKPPTVTWRAGLDLDPVDVTDDEQVRWLRCLVWPGQPDRQRALGAAVAVARSDPPRLIRGDLTRDLPAVAAQAPDGATLVVYHSATLAYVDQAGRRAFTAAVRRTRAVWLSNEAPGLVPEEPSPGEVAPAAGRQLVLIRDGRRRLALADGHGAWLHWVG